MCYLKLVVYIVKASLKRPVRGWGPDQWKATLVREDRVLELTLTDAPQPRH